MDKIAQHPLLGASLDVLVFLAGSDGLEYYVIRALFTGSYGAAAVVALELAALIRGVVLQKSTFLNGGGRRGGV